jgi:ferredoxin
MRAPRLVREWLARQDGQGRKCALFLTYGAFQVHPAHYTTCEILKKSNFQVVASAEFPGAHTFNLGGWTAGVNRPDDSDLKVAREYAETVYRRFSGQDPGLIGDLDQGPYTEEQLDQFEGFRFRVLTKLPTRDNEECQMCMLCEELCPSGAMDAEKGEANPAACICCLRCVRHCPDEVLKINDMRDIFRFKMEHDQETDETLRQKKSRIYL